MWPQREKERRKRLSMAMSEIIKQLESLAEHCGSMIDKEEPEDIWKADVEALNQAIEKLQGECVGTDPAEIIRRLLEKEGLNQKELAERMGVVRQNVSQALNRNAVSMRFDNFERMTSALGYEIIVRKK